MSGPVDVLARGELVQTYFDTGAMGVTVLYGEVIESGPKAARVRWESGLTNRIRHGETRVTRARDQQEARAALARVGGAP